jgi:hypothetical protein
MTHPHGRQASNLEALSRAHESALDTSGFMRLRYLPPLGSRWVYWILYISIFNTFELEVVFVNDGHTIMETQCQFARCR